MTPEQRENKRFPIKKMKGKQENKKTTEASKGKKKEKMTRLLYCTVKSMRGKKEIEEKGKVTEA